MKIYYNSKLKEKARQLRNNSTKSEIKLWCCLKGKQFFGYDFHRQKPIDNYIVDFFCNRLKLAIECDGYSHQLEEVYNKDVQKTARLNSFGISVLRFSDNQILEDLNNVLVAIEIYIREFEERGNNAPNPPLKGWIL